MKLRQRKLIGTIATVLFIIVYSLVTMAVGGIYVVGSGVLIELGFFIIAGFGWIPIAMFIIRWMSKPDY
jgi:hypothetical protein